MTFDEILAQGLALLQRQGRVLYRALEATLRPGRCLPVLTEIYGWFTEGFDTVDLCQDVDMSDADDEEHLEYATSQGRSVITGDEDFLALDAPWRRNGKHHAGIVYLSPDRKDAIGAIVAYVMFLH